MADRCRLTLLEEAPLILPPALTSLADRFVSTPTGFENVGRLANNGSIQMGISPSSGTKVWTSDDYMATYSEKGADLITAGYSSQTYGLATDGSIFMVGGYSRVAISNALGNSWVSTSLSTLWGGLNFIRGIAYGNGIWMVAGDNGKVATSPDGINWTDRTAALVSGGWSSTVGINDVIFDGANFAIIGDGTQFGISANGSSWATYSVGVSSNRLCWTGSNFIAVGNNGSVRKSADGTSWAAVTSHLSATGSSWSSIDDIYHIDAWAGRIVFVGTDNTIMHSDDEGVSWTGQEMSTLGATSIGTNAYCLDYFNNKLCIGGYTVYAYEP